MASTAITDAPAMSLSEGNADTDDMSVATDETLKVDAYCDNATYDSAMQITEDAVRAGIGTITSDPNLSEKLSILLALTDRLVEQFD
jgi:hypothetical protein